MAVEYLLDSVPHKEQHRAAHGLLADMLKRLYGIDYTEDMITKGKYGKPYLADYPDIFFNLSHSEGITACIVDRSECGVDCERVREYRPNVMKRAFSEAERAAVEAAPESERNLIFFILWTLKEAYIKAIGMGLSFPLEKAEFSIVDGEISSSIEGYEFRTEIIGNGEFVISTAIKL